MYEFPLFFRPFFLQSSFVRIVRLLLFRRENIVPILISYLRCLLYTAHPHISRHFAKHLIIQMNEWTTEQTNIYEYSLWWSMAEYVQSTLVQTKNVSPSSKWMRKWMENASMKWVFDTHSHFSSRSTNGTVATSVHTGNWKKRRRNSHHEK